MFGMSGEAIFSLIAAIFMGSMAMWSVTGLRRGAKPRYMTFSKTGGHSFQMSRGSLWCSFFVEAGACAAFLGMAFTLGDVSVCGWTTAAIAFVGGAFWWWRKDRQTRSDV